MKLVNKIVVVLIFLICMYTVFLIFSDVNLIYDKLLKFKVEFLLIILPLLISGWLILFLRWHLLLRNSKINIPIRSSLTIYFSGFALALIPGNVGDWFIKSQILKKKNYIPRVKTIGIVISESFYTMTGLVLLSLIGTFFFEFSLYIGITVGIFLILFFCLINSKRLFLKFSAITSKRKFIFHFVELMLDSFDIIKNSTRGKIALISILLSTLFWLIESISVYFIINALGVTEVNLLEMISIYSGAMILGFASFLPLGIGVVEGSLIGFLNYKGVDVSIGLASVIAIRIFTTWFPILIGFIALKKNNGLKID